MIVMSIMMPEKFRKLISSLHGNFMMNLFSKLALNMNLLLGVL
jgi:hypothetical protein